MKQLRITSQEIEGIKKVLKEEKRRKEILRTTWKNFALYLACAETIVPGFTKNQIKTQEKDLIRRDLEKAKIMDSIESIIEQASYMKIANSDLVKHIGLNDKIEKFKKILKEKRDKNEWLELGKDAGLLQILSPGFIEMKEKELEKIKEKLELLQEKDIEKFIFYTSYIKIFDKFVVKNMLTEKKMKEIDASLEKERKEGIENGDWKGFILQAARIITFSK